MLHLIREWGLMPEVGTIIISAVTFTAVVAVTDLILDLFEPDPPPIPFRQFDTVARWADGSRKYWRRER